MSIGAAAAGGGRSLILPLSSASTRSITHVVRRSISAAVQPQSAGTSRGHEGLPQEAQADPSYDDQSRIGENPLSSGGRRGSWPSARPTSSRRRCGKSWCGKASSSGPATGNTNWASRKDRPQDKQKSCVPFFKELRPLLRTQHALKQRPYWPSVAFPYSRRQSDRKPTFDSWACVPRQFADLLPTQAAAGVEYVRRQGLVIGRKQELAVPAMRAAQRAA